MENENSAVKPDISGKESRQEKYLNAISNPKNRGLVSRACKDAGISRETFYQWKNSDPNFAEKAERAKELGKESFEDEAEDALWDLVMEREKTAVIFVAKTRLKKRGFVEKQEIEIDSKQSNINLNVVDPSEQ